MEGSRDRACLINHRILFTEHPVRLLSQKRFGEPLTYVQSHIQQSVWLREPLVVTGHPTLPMRAPPAIRNAFQILFSQL